MKNSGSSPKPPDVATLSKLPSQELANLLEASRRLAASRDMDKVLQQAMESALSILALDSAAIYLIEDQNLYLAATTPALPVKFPEDLRRTNLSDHPHIQAALEAGYPTAISDSARITFSQAEYEVVDLRRMGSIVYVPCFHDGQPVGILIAGSTELVRDFLPMELELADALSFQISGAIANTHRLKLEQNAKEALKRSYDATLEGWAIALEMRDEDTQGHTLRVAERTLALARRMQVPETELEHIRRGALLHDIGKINLPDSILRKPGLLSEEEWSVIRTHPELAYWLLYKIDFLVPAIDIPYNHHERWDGSGYPRGLKSIEIPLAARIFAVVDTFDAMTSDRPYRKAWPRRTALQYIQDKSGSYFDPDVVHVFLKMSREHPRIW